MPNLTAAAALLIIGLLIGRQLAAWRKPDAYGAARNYTLLRPHVLHPTPWSQADDALLHPVQAEHAHSLCPCLSRDPAFSKACC